LKEKKKLALTESVSVEKLNNIKYNVSPKKKKKHQNKNNTYVVKRDVSAVN
jgi:hypothetical protein